VWGKFANYTYNLPEHSFVNVEDFRTPKHFAEYVMKVCVVLCVLLED
jgi:hypothetical protein